jgi:hypothetical protein
LANFPSIVDGIVKHLSLLGVADVLVTLATKYSDALSTLIVTVPAGIGI